MKQRFLNQKLGKRASRKIELRKAKLAAGLPERPPHRGVRGRNALAGKPP